MNKNVKNYSDQSEDQSLGILSMENLKVFGETSRNQASLGNSRICERLNIERLKAFETLQKTQRSDFFKKPQSRSNKENAKTLGTTTPKLDHTDYVPYRRPNTINISDLVTDETINLENSSDDPPSSAAKENQISFDPAEMTGRSTQYNKDLKKQRSSMSSTRLSVSEILASSFAPKARNLGESLRDSAVAVNAGGAATLARLSSITSSASSTSYNGSRSLPRTADMSMSKASGCSEVSFGAAMTAGEFSFAAGGGMGADNSAFSAEDFAPGEHMQSKLLLDEISWAQQYAAIPAAALSEKAKAKANRSSIMMSNGFELTSATNSMIIDDPNFSVGNFFNMRSDNIWNIVQTKSPEKGRAPIALVDETDDTVTTTTSISSELDSASSIALTPQIDNKTYSRVASGNTVTLLEPQHKQHESKDSGNASDNSYLLSMSAIDRALCNLDIQTDDSELGVVNKILLQAKKPKQLRDLEPEVEVDRCTREHSIDAEIKQRFEMILENKENLDPNSYSSGHLSDTMSFTDSLLNSSEMRKLNDQTTISQARSPLSPIENVNPVLLITDTGSANEADIDEWPSTPIKSPNRRTRRTKSPRDSVSPQSNLVAAPSATKTPMHSNRSTVVSYTQAKSLCSTRLDGDKNAVPAQCDFALSPNLSKTLVASPHMRNNSRHSAIVSPRGGSPAAIFEISPMSSPRSVLSSQASSPSAGYHSPNLDSTTSSDRRYLNAGTSIRKSASSPVISDARSKPMRLNSAALIKCSTSAAAGRSASRCSNSSEFSHRDGKAIPLKVTTLELSWGSTKLRTDVRKSMQVKNIANKRLVVRVEVHGPGFQIVNAQSNILTLQSQECRSIIINFCPTVTGVAIGVLSFCSPQGTTTSNASFLDIPLYGYGGHSSILPQSILKGPVGSAFMPMGDLRDLTRPLERCFKINNKGPLLGFAIVRVDSIGLDLPRLCDTFEIRPNRMLIAPGNTITVRIIFRPKREDIKKIIKKIANVLTLANMRIICGDEANRQRMRQLVGRMSGDELAKISSGSLDMLWTEFPSEVDMSELDAFKERPDVILDLLTHMRVHDIALTLNHDSLDETADSSSLFFPDADETVLFRTVCAAASPTPQQMLLDPVHELLEGSITEADDERAVSSTREGSWSVRPNMLEFDFYAERRQERVSILIRNSYKSRQYFEVVCNYKDLFRLTPSEGYVEPDGGQIEVEVNSRHEKPPANLPSGEVMLMVYMENERIAVPVKFPADNLLER